MRQTFISVIVIDYLQSRFTRTSLKPKAKWALFAGSAGRWHCKKHSHRSKYCRRFSHLNTLPRVCSYGRLQILFCSSLWPVTSHAPLVLLLWSLMFHLHSEVADTLYLVLSSSCAQFWCHFSFLKLITRKDTANNFAWVNLVKRDCLPVFIAFSECSWHLSFIGMNILWEVSFKVGVAFFFF